MSANEINSSGPFWLPGNPSLRRATLALMDGLLIAAGLAVNFEIWLRFRHGEIPPEYRSLFFHVVLPIALIRVGSFHFFGLYKAIARHAGNYELMLVAMADTTATALIILLNSSANLIPRLGSFPLNDAETHLLRLPWGVIFNDWMLTLILIAGVRLLRREAAARFFDVRPGAARRVLIAGSGGSGEQVARDLFRATQGAYLPVAYVDPDPAMKGHRLHGVPVVGSFDDLVHAIEKYQPDEIVIALQRAAPKELARIVEHCRTARLKFKIVPPLGSVMSGQVGVSMLRPVEIEDLLERDPVDLSAQEALEYLAGKRVLITGAGGSIGRELCRQLIHHAPAKIILLGRGENSLFEAQIELETALREAGIISTAIIGDVRDESLMEKIFQEHKPQVVFHAAAHKHVHYMETQPAEAVKNNVQGTRTVAEAAARSGVEKFIFISTDKAVRPTGVMGASKRVAELIVTAMNGGGRGEYLSVRFGNVLGSRGSVIPTFRRQIEQGGPVTVTHPEVTRYFMTTREAVHLVIQAGAIGRGGELFVLDMGKPVKIIDLARNLITLSGLEPEKDITIEFTGLRPGEKMTEELLTQDEGVSKTDHGKIFIARSEVRPWDDLRPQIQRLIDAAERGEESGIRSIFHELIPDFVETSLTQRCKEHQVSED